MATTSDRREPPETPVTRGSVWGDTTPPHPPVEVAELGVPREADEQAQRAREAEGDSRRRT